MIVANYVTKRPSMSETRTYEDFYKFLGSSPTKLGVVSKLYPQNTLPYITECLGNVFYNKPSGNKYQSIDSLYFEWDIETNYIKRVEFADVPVGDGSGGTEILVSFRENYYNEKDIIVIEDSRQQLFILSNADRKSDNYWTHRARLVTNDYNHSLDLNSCQEGMTTRFQSVAMPELHETGYCKYQSNVEKHRNWITTFRTDVDYSALYAAHEDVFINVGQGKDKSSLKNTVYKMNKKEKDCLENFLFARNNGMLTNRSNIDVNGKPTISDPETGRPIYIGDGIIPQIEKYASKIGYNKLSEQIFIQSLALMNEKAENPTGNKYMFMCNEAMWNHLQFTLRDMLPRMTPTGTYFWSQKANDYVKVGNTFDSYEFGGNTITFKVDRALTREFGNKGYGIFIDLTADSATGTPAIQMFTLKGGEFMTSKYKGVGGLSGLESGDVSSPVAGTKLINWGYGGAAVFNPYRSVILIEHSK